jgi:hypothetical protein
MPRARTFELGEYKHLAKWFTNILSLATFFFRISRF